MGMGRTKRRRKRNNKQHFRVCCCDDEVIRLNSWLIKQGVRRSKKLKLAIFKESGRGVLTKKNIRAGEELINLPLHSTINVTTLLLDPLFCSIFIDNKKLCLQEFERSVSFQSLIAFYILFLKVQGADSSWHIYLNSLPKTYTVPYFLSNELTCLVDAEIRAVINNQKDIIDSSFNIYRVVLNETNSRNTLVKDFVKHFNRSEYEWAYFTVNTRCVYMDLSNLINLTNKDNTILALVKDSTKISLCPFLDMINHSPTAKNETKLLINTNIENIPVETLTENVFSDVRFSIFTKNNFQKFSEVFICYGDSYNLKLVTEYGFYLPMNDLDYVAFEFEKIKIFLNLMKVKLSSDQLDFINKHGLYKDLYIDFRGLSFNLCGLLMVVKHYYAKDVNVSKLLYSAAIQSNDKTLTDVIKPMVKEKLNDLKLAVNKLKSYNDCVILNNCVELMCQFIRILEKFIKC
ncbi:SET domain-containing protein 4 [Leptidea sinapis]|uniref:SET domain-containing protein 4 n=1 Tax=Leptidea sinapis TaxID=189913 RepID=UPI00214110A7|nr:SET domain-containing protein 4 [Leptidea sinapis]